MMERSSRFISLSGLSGISAGLWAIAGATAVYLYWGITPFVSHHYFYSTTTLSQPKMDYRIFFFSVAAIVLLGAIASGIFFTTRQARRTGQKTWDALTRRLLLHLAIPLATGGIFCIALFTYRLGGLIAPTTLIFYGLALLNASKYTLPDIQWLGCLEIALGLIALFFLGYGLEFWTLGFGVLHIVYGTIMYNKYERNPAAV